MNFQVGVPGSLSTIFQARIPVFFEGIDEGEKEYTNGRRQPCKRTTEKKKKKKKKKPTSRSFFMECINGPVDQEKIQAGSTG